MIKIDAIINEDEMEDVKDALQELQVHGMTISQVMGCGTQMGYKEKVRGYDVDINLLPKVKFEIVVSSQECHFSYEKSVSVNELWAMSQIGF